MMNVITEMRPKSDIYVINFCIHMKIYPL